MIRTIISIDKDDKRWLDSYTKSHHISSAETFRRALQLMKKIESQETGNIISKTSGLWKDRKLDSVEFADTLRKEWDERQRKISC